MLTFGIILIVVIVYLPDGLTGQIQRLRRRRLGGQHANT
jgi:ABC-type branched-subunit amino acid transport system permease subunit